MKIFQIPSVIGYSNVIYLNFFQSNFSTDKNEFGNNRIESLVCENLNLINEKYLHWISPSTITNSIISITHENSLTKKSKLNLLMQFYIENRCKHIVLHFLGSIEISIFNNLLKGLHKSNIHSVLIICDFYKHYYTDEFGEVIMNIPINKKLIVFDSPFDKNFEDTMFFSSKKKTSHFKKSILEFNANITLFSESQSHHTYFNRKLYIGPNGEIKNAPECEETFGNFNDLKSPEDLKKIIQTPEFQKYWFVHKEITDVCKDCEFRHMCVDNRLPYEREKNAWYHKIECNYNPYIAKWEGEEGYRTLAECGVTSNEHEFSIDHEKIALINKELWGDE